MSQSSYTQPHSSRQDQDDDNFFSLLPKADRKAIWDRLSRPPPCFGTRPVPAKPAPPSRFKADYWHIAGPKLLRLIISYAPLVRLEVYSFSAAWDQVWQLACQYGAMHLPDPAIPEIHAWIEHEMLLRLDDPLPDGLVTPARLHAITGEG